MTTSLIPAEQHIAIAAALFAIALFGFWAEKQSWGKLVTGAVWSILGAIVASNLGIIPQSAAAYGFVFQYLVPVLIPLFLIHADIRTIIVESGRVGFAFILACLGTVLGAATGAVLIDLGAREGDLAGIFTATYTGGSVNYAALIQATGFDDASVIAAATAVDSLMSALFLALLAILPASKWLLSKFAQRRYDEAFAVATKDEKPPVTGFSLAAALAFALAVVALADWLVYLCNRGGDFDFSRLRYVFITALAVIPATLMPTRMAHLEGGQTIGLVLAFVFFAAIAAGADISQLINTAPVLLVFVAVLLSVHALVVFGLGSLIAAAAHKFSHSKDAHWCALSLPELIIASNAAILGATTAPALAIARGWPALATPGILVGVAGYIVGTPLGIFVAAWLT